MTKYNINYTNIHLVPIIGFYNDWSVTARMTIWRYRIYIVNLLGNKNRVNIGDHNSIVSPLVKDKTILPNHIQNKAERTKW